MWWDCGGVWHVQCPVPFLGKVFILFPYAGVVACGVKVLVWRVVCVLLRLQRLCIWGFAAPAWPVHVHAPFVGAEVDCDPSLPVAGKGYV